jgi:hypothetical protein
MPKSGTTTSRSAIGMDRLSARSAQAAARYALVI